MRVKSNIRNKLITLLSVVLLSAVMCWGVMLNGFNANTGIIAAAEESVAEGKPVGATFEVDNSASVRLLPDGKGIKFRANMTSEYYSWLKETYPDATYTIKVEVNRFNNPVESAAVYSTYVLSDSDFQDVDGAKTDFSYSYTLSYDKLEDITDQQRKQAYALVVKAQASVTVTKAGQEDIVVPAEGYCVRNMMAIAKYLVDSGLYKSEADLNVLKSYYDVAEATAITTPANIDFLHKGTNNAGETVDVLTFDSAIDENYTLYINAIPLTKISSTQFEISEELRGQLEYDKDYTVYAFDKDNKCTTLTAHTYAGIIKNAQEFQDVFGFSETNVKKYAKEKVLDGNTYYADVERDFSGNYVLANDISLTIDHDGMKLNRKSGGNNPFYNINAGEVTAIGGNIENLFFNNGTLDGQGHKITVSLNSLYGNVGLFGHLGDNVTIKNLCLYVNDALKNQAFYKNFLGKETAPVIDNCYVKLTGPKATNGANTVMAASSITVKNSVIDYSDLTTNTEYTNALFGDAKSTFENTVMIGDKRPLVGAKYASNEQGESSVAGVYRFDDYADFATSVSSTDFNADNFNSYWDKTTVGVPVYKQDGISLEFSLESYKDGATLKLEVGQEFDVSATYFGAPALVTITSNGDNITIANDTITANSVGEGVLSVEYTLDGKKVSYSVSYEVIVKAVEVTTEVYYSNVDKLIHGLSFDGTFTSAYQGANEVTLTASEKGVGVYTVSGLTVADTTVKGITELIVNTSEGSYKFTNVVTVEKIIASVDDWTYLNISAGDTATKVGYVLVINDLDTTSMINLHTMGNKGSIRRNNESVENNGGWYSTLGLRGTFDGNGKTIKVKSAKNGIFGVINTLTIKDVCFIVDATAQYPVGEEAALQLESDKRINYILASGMKDSKLENVVVKINSVDLSYNNYTLENAYLMLTATTLRSGMTNFVLDYGSYTMTDNNKWGGLLALNLDMLNRNAYDNVYIVHNGGYRISCYSDPIGNGAGNLDSTVAANTYYAKNESDEIVESGTKGKINKEVYRYDSIENLVAATEYTNNSAIKWSYSSANGKWEFKAN